MKTLKVLAVVLLATFCFTSADAQIRNKKHREIMRHHRIVRHRRHM